MMLNTDEPQHGGDSRGGIARTLLFLLLGPIIWGGHGVAMYASHTGLCAFDLAGSTIFGLEPMRAISVAVTVTALALIAPALFAPQAVGRLFGMQPGLDWRFYRGSAALLAVLSAAGVAWTGAMAFFIPACMQLR